jgi:hypothetical protein
LSEYANEIHEGRCGMVAGTSNPLETSKSSQ